jgi:hypothetical protein
LFKPVHNWVKKFSQGCSKVADDAEAVALFWLQQKLLCSGWKELIRADRRITIDSAATALGCSYGIASCMVIWSFRKCVHCECPENRRIEKKLKERVCPCNISYSMQMKEKICLQNCYWGRIMGASLPTQIKVCFNAMEPSQFTFNQKV